MDKGISTYSLLTGGHYYEDGSIWSEHDGPVVVGYYFNKGGKRVEITRHEYNYMSNLAPNPSRIRRDLMIALIPHRANGVWVNQDRREAAVNELTHGIYITNHQASLVAHGHYHAGPDGVKIGGVPVPEGMSINAFIHRAKKIAASN